MRPKQKLALYKTTTAILSCALAISLAFSALLLAKTKKNLPQYEKDSTDSITSLPEESSPVTEAVTSSPHETCDEILSSLSSEYESEASELRDLVDKYADAASGAFGAQAENFAKLLEIVTDPNRPKRILYDEDDEPTGEKTPAKVAFTYTDLTTGYSFSYNGDEIMYTASLIKAPYLYAVLKSVEEFEVRKMNFAADGTPLYGENGEALFDGAHPNLDADGNIIYLEGEAKFNLSRKWHYDSKTMFEKGSGEIQKKKDGFELTYLELIEYALKYSDNIAFAQVKKTFGNAEYEDLASDLEIIGISKGFMQLSSNDCAKFLTEIHKFCESGSKYGTVMKNALSKTAHEVLIPVAVSPTPSIHKYGWDKGAYHDMGIVYDTRPFSIVVMTDLDTYNGENNAFIHRIIKSVLQMHRDFAEGT